MDYYDSFLQKKVASVKVYKRRLNSSSGSAVKSSGLVHEGVVAKTQDNCLYLIESGVDSSDDANYLECRRRGDARIIRVSESEVRDWILVRQVLNTEPNLTLDNLLYACAGSYSLTLNNCWNAVERMVARATQRGSGFSWQRKLALLAAVFAVIAYASIHVKLSYA